MYCIVYIIHSLYASVAKRQLSSSVTYEEPMFSTEFAFVSNFNNNRFDAGLVGALIDGNSMSKSNILTFCR